MLSGYAREIAALGAQDVGRAIAHTGHLAVIFLLVLSAGLMVVAGVDVPLQIIQLMQKLRMSRKEVKDELKQTRSEEHTSELQSLMRISYADCCLKKKKKK